MTIYLNEDNRIITDPYNYIFQTRIVAGKDAKNPGEERWNSQSFHSTLEQALLKYHRTNMMAIDSDDADRIIEAIKESEQAIVAVLEKWNGE